MNDSPLSVPDNPLDLLERPAFRNELAQIGARATLATLETESTVKWRYRAERVVRNLTAIGQELRTTALDETSTPELVSLTLLAARGWENLATLEERVDRSVALLNSATLYELAGYQANAACLARLAVDRRRWTTTPAFDGLLSAFVQRLFLRVQTMAPVLARFPGVDAIPTEADLLRRAGLAVASVGLSDAALFFMSGEEEHLTSSLDSLARARDGLREAGDAVSYNAVAGMEQLVPLMARRSTWRHLGELSDAPRWRRYLKVLARGLNDDLLEARSISELWPSQRAALDGGLLDDAQSLVVRMPTSAGKTRIAELAIVHTLVTTPGSKCVYIAPYRALANEIEGSFANLFHDLGYGASTIPGGYDQDEMGQAIASTDDVLVLTPEKLDLLFRLRTEILDKVALIVVDEGHIVADRERGPKFELLISRLRRRIPDARFLMMSAVVPDETLADFSRWLGSAPESAVTTDWRPSLLKYGRLDWNGTSGWLRFAESDVPEGGLEFIPDLIEQTEYPHIAEETGRWRRPKFPRSDNKGEVAAEITYQFAPLGPVLIFSMQTNWAESIASALLRRINLAELTDEPVDQVFALRRESRTLAVAIEWLGEDHFVTELLRRGIAFHHGRLPDAVRDAIEEEFRERRLAVLVATSTLAQGVNLPVRTVVMHSCRSREADGSPRILTAREYWNIAGRAGRAGSETEGTVIHIASSPHDVDDFQRYSRRRENVERVESALHRMLRDLVDERISSDEAALQLDADLLALLVEEDEGALDDAAMSETLTSSLFHIQAMELGESVEPLIGVMTSTARRISTDIPDIDSRRLYASTGLSSKSCQVIAAHVDENEEAIRRLLTESDLGDRDEFLDILLEGLAEVREMEPRTALRTDTRELLTSWMDGQLVRNIAAELDAEDPQDLTEFIEDAFAYRLPWGVSGYIRIAAANTDSLVTSSLASNLAGMIKYGVPSPQAVWAMTAGVASRTAAIAVANEYLRTNTDQSLGQFRRWLGRLDPNNLADRLGLSGAELESTARAVLRSQPNEYLDSLDATGELLPLDAVARPTRAAIDSGLAYQIEVGDILAVRRDLDSRINRNAVFLALGNQRLGYLQADAARALAPELDVGLSVAAEVTEVGASDGRPEEFHVSIRRS